MLIKCETKSHRVKGLSFHPKLSWILASLHNGAIQLWDYRFGSLIDRFEDHEGPVRGVDFHPSQPLFVSGGDDYRVKVWSYRQRRCIFTLLGHLDYIRTVFFHPEYPWILSASDDQTVRIWNWQSRNCLAVLTGHGHYVMCAQFHPRNDLVVSASLDQMVRVWDISGLREKTVSRIAPGGVGAIGGAFGGHPPASDLFGASDAVCKHILEGHDRGVNWACFHHSAPLIASGADDRHIKLWRYNDTKAWEVDTLRGHFNNVSCVMFHPTSELLLSNSEDRTIRVWDVNQRQAIHTFRRENDRCWILTAQRDSDLIAVGHDCGLVVFKLDRERPPHECIDDALYTVKDKWLIKHNLVTDTSVSLVATRRASSALGSGPRQLLVNHFNTADTNILLVYPESESTSAQYDLITFDGNTELTTKTGTAGSSASLAFVSRSRFAVLSQQGGLRLFNMNNEMTKKIDTPIVADKIFSLSPNKLILATEDRIVSYDLTTNKVIAELGCTGVVRSAILSPNKQQIAFMSKHNILFANAKTLEYLFCLHENIRLKSGCWDDMGAFVYTTLSHTKYCLPLGDRGIIHSLPATIYAFKVAQQKIYYLDRHKNIHIDPINTTEYMFKLSLQRQRFDQVALYIRNGRLCGNAVISYLKSAGFPEVAMQFVSDPKTRFNLALAYGNIDEATDAAHKIDDEATWSRLGAEALRLGKFHIRESVLQKIKCFDQLSFLYLVSGNFFKLGKMLKIAQRRKEVMSRFHNALMLGDVEERVRILAEVGQTALAAVTAKIHHLDELSDALKETVNGLNLDAMTPPEPKLFIPRVPIVWQSGKGAESNDWPFVLTEAPTSSKFADAMHAVENLPSNVAALSLSKGITSMVSADEQVKEKNGQDGFGGEGLCSALQDEAETVNQGVWGDMDDALAVDEELSDRCTAGGAPEGPVGTYSTQAMTVRGLRPQARWLKGQPMIADVVAAGEFDEALAQLQSRIGLVNAAPLKPLFQAVAQGSVAYVEGLPQTANLEYPLLRSGSLKDQRQTPLGAVSMAALLEAMKRSHRQVTAGNFEAALDLFRATLQSLTLATADSQECVTQLNEVMENCRQYVIGLRLEVSRMRLPQDEAHTARQVELAVYFATCELQPTHQYLVLRRAAGVCSKAKNFLSCAAMCRRLLQNNSIRSMKGPEEMEKVKKMMMSAEAKGTDQHEINFDPSDREPLVICSESLTRLNPTEPTVKCPFCGSVANMRHKGGICSTCRLCELGARVLGLQFMPVV